MSRTKALAAAVLPVVLAAGAAASSAADPFAFFGPGLSLSERDRSRVEAGKVYVRIVSSRTRDLEVVAASRIDVGGDRLVAWTREVEALHRGKYVPLIVRFSDPPVLADLRALALEDDELNDIRGCRPTSCGVKLSDAEIHMLHAVIGREGDRWKPAVQDAFRQIVLARVQQYLDGGQATAADYVDEEAAVSPEAEFRAVIAPWLPLSLPFRELGEFLCRYPRAPGNGIESFLYWSKEVLGAAKPIVSVTHVAIAQSSEPRAPEAMVATKQVYATHYMTGSLSITAVTRPTYNGARFLLYQNRTRADVFKGLLGGVIRRTIEGRVRNAAPDVLLELRKRLESGDPPSSAAH